MASILHALTGHGDHPEKKSNSSSVVTVTYEDVQVKSTVSSQTQTKGIGSDSQTKIHALMSKLGSTHSQIDEYSRHRTDKISEAVKSSIEKIVHLTQTQQQQLLDDAQKETGHIEEEYTRKLTM